MGQEDNPCLTCPDICCALKGECGLRLSQDEFIAHFEAHRQGLRVRQEGSLVIISARDGLVCPNLGEKGCRIYEERPLDCRLYPYQMLPVYETKTAVKFMLYQTPTCVAGRTFNILEQEARGLVEAFGRNLYGERKIIIQIFEDRFLPKLKNRLVKLLVRFGHKLGIV